MALAHWTHQGARSSDQGHGRDDERQVLGSAGRRHNRDVRRARRAWLQPAPPTHYTPARK